MALTPSIELSQAYVSSITDGATPNIQLSQAFVLSVANFPTEELQLSQALVQIITSGATPSIEVSQSFVLVVARGRIDDPNVRAWTFTLDGHDYYVLRLGNIETLVYDTASQQWYVWGSGETDLWRAYTGINWRGAQRWGRIFGSDVVVGDDGNGAIYLLNPDEDFDDDAIVGAEVPRTYVREFVAQYVISGGYDFTPCYGIQVFGSIGQIVDAQDVTLEVSDNRGQTYVSAGVRTLPVDEFQFRVQWQSLGSMRAPGRLFRVTDTGALHRVDAVDMVVQDGGGNG